MSLVDLVSEVESLLPPKVHSVLVELAKEVDSHKELLAAAGALGGPVGETVATGVEDVSASVESTETASSAPTTTSTDGEGGSKTPLADTQETPPTQSSGEAESGTDTLPGNHEQSLPYEDWPKTEA